MDASRATAIQWARDNRCDFKDPVFPPPSGWMWVGDDGLALVPLFTHEESREITKIDVDTYGMTYQEYIVSLRKQKHQGAILAIDAEGSAKRLSLTTGLNRIGWDEFLIAAHSYVVVMQRAYLEKNPRFRQFLPYVTFIQIVNDRLMVFAYERGKGVGESRLAGDISVGLGGHTEFADVLSDAEEPDHEQVGGDDAFFGVPGVENIPNGIIHLEDTLTLSVGREMLEEVNYQHVHDTVDTDAFPLVVQENGEWDYFNGLIVDDNEVGRVHLGLSLVIQLKPDADLSWLRCTEKELVTIGMVDAKELRANPKIEGWTRIVLDSLIADYAEAV
jgi:predicted NUDIX family phosphoesterase